MENNLIAFDQLGAEITTFVQPALTVKVTEKAVADTAVITLKTVKDFEKRVEAKRKELVAPHNNQVKMINDYAKKILAPIEQAEAHLKAELRKFEMELERIRREELAKAEAERKRLEAEAQEKIRQERELAETMAMFATAEEAQKTTAEVDMKATMVATELELAHKSNVASIESQKVSGARRLWTFRVTDPSQVPAEFLIVDEKKIREAVRAGARQIPGVEIFQDLQIAAR